MKIENKRICPTCHSELSPTMDFCPVCTLRKALGEVQPLQLPAFQDASGPVAGQRFEHYEVVRDENGTPMELGRGAMGVTYKAFDIDLRYFVALKVINEKYLGNEWARLRFLREARAAARVRH